MALDGHWGLIAGGAEIRSFWSKCILWLFFNSVQV